MRRARLAGVGRPPRDRDFANAQIDQAVYDTVRAIREEAALVKASGIRDSEDAYVGRARLRRRGQGERQVVTCPDQIRGWAMASESAAKLSCIANLAKPWLTVKPAAFDADRHSINVMNGTLRLEHVSDDCSEWLVRLDAHARGDLITKPARRLRSGSRLPDLRRVDGNVAARRRHAGFLHAVGGIYPHRRYQRTEDRHPSRRRGRTASRRWSRRTPTSPATMPRRRRSRRSSTRGGRKKAATRRPPRDARGRPVPARGRARAGRQARRGADQARDRRRADAGAPSQQEFFDLVPQFKLTSSATTSRRSREPTTASGGACSWCRGTTRSRTRTRTGSCREAPRRGERHPQPAGRGPTRLADGRASGARRGHRRDRRYRDSADPLGRFLEIATVRRAGVRTQATALHLAYVAWANRRARSTRSRRSCSA